MRKVGALSAYRSQFPLQPGMFPEFLLREMFGCEYFVAPAAGRPADPGEMAPGLIREPALSAPPRPGSRCWRRGDPQQEDAPRTTARDETTVDQGRGAARILEFFRASPEEYEVIFTPNATGALRLVGESYPFGPGGQYLLTFDNHNSVNGIRPVYARSRSASPLRRWRPPSKTRTGCATMNSFR